MHDFCFGGQGGVYPHMMQVDASKAGGRQVAGRVQADTRGERKKRQEKKKKVDVHGQTGRAPLACPAGPHRGSVESKTIALLTTIVLYHYWWLADQPEMYCVIAALVLSSPFSLLSNTSASHLTRSFSFFTKLAS